MQGPLWVKKQGDRCMVWCLEWGLPRRWLLPSPSAAVTGRGSAVGSRSGLRMVRGRAQPLGSGLGFIFYLFFFNKLTISNLHPTFLHCGSRILPSGRRLGMDWGGMEKPRSQPRMWGRCWRVEGTELAHAGWPGAVGKVLRRSLLPFITWVMTFGGCSLLWGVSWIYPRCLIRAGTTQTPCASVF